jgi:predicted Zn finger-like uncharacterized protein
MDVQCERCKTEYEFDDALVSGRGTTVKCTNCGFQFRLRPAVDGTGLTERWMIRTAGGAELVFTTLRELQRAISNRQVGRGDTLRRGNTPPRLLGDIAELEPFFPEQDLRDATSPHATLSPLAGVPTVLGMASAPAEARDPSNGMASPFVHTSLSAGTPGPSSKTVTTVEYPAPRDRLVTLRPPSDDVAAVPPPAAARLVPATSAPPEDSGAFVEAGTLVAPSAHLGSDSHRTGREAWSEPETRTVEIAALLPSPTEPLRRRVPSFEDIETRDSNAPDPVYSMAPQRRRVGGWIVALVLLLGVSIIGYNVARPYLSADAKSSGASAPLDPRATQFLSDGERAMADGNLDLATENFDKASVLGEKDPHVRLDVARLTAVRADIPWLKLRLLPEAASDDIRATQQQLSDLGPALRRAAADALSAAPDDPAAVRVKVDALRILGERDEARALVAKMGNGSQPETSYVLAALDLAEVAPLWTVVIDRLRVAAAAEGNLGRARAALVYALARKGDVASAKNELDGLANLARPHPLVAPLRAFLTRGSVGPTSDAGAPPPPAPPAVEVSAPARAAVGEVVDPRALLQQAADAENRGQLPRAAKLYEDALRSDARSSEALAGLGSVALKQGDNATARLQFGRALAINPNYVPALVGQADALWAEGDRNAATTKYKDLVDRFPESSGFPSYVKTRAAAGSPSGAAAAATPTPSPQVQDAGAAPSPAAPPSHPGELTLPSNVPSDLPGTTP